MSKSQSGKVGGQDIPGRGKKRKQAVLQNHVCLELSTYSLTKI